jgi:hypothetical protein
MVFQPQLRHENHGGAADFWGMKKKRGKNEEKISMVKKANAFFFSGSYFLFPFLLFS